MIAQILQTKDKDLLEKMYDKVYEKFVEEIDANDNGIPTHDGPPRYSVTTTLPSRVANCRPAWNDEQQDFDGGFFKAMEIVSKVSTVQGNRVDLRKIIPTSNHCQMVGNILPFNFCTHKTFNEGP